MDDAVEFAEEILGIELEPWRADFLRMFQALNALKRGDNCWCEMSIGNPMLNEHTRACLLARKAMEISWPWLR